MSRTRQSFPPLKLIASSSNLYRSSASAMTAREMRVWACTRFASGVRGSDASQAETLASRRRATVRRSWEMLRGVVVTLVTVSVVMVVRTLPVAVGGMLMRETGSDPVEMRMMRMS